MFKERAYEYPDKNEGRWNQRKGRWVSAQEDFEILRLNNPIPVSREEQYKNYSDLAAEDVPGISQFCKYIISGVHPPQKAISRGGKVPYVRLNVHKVPK